MDMNSSIKAIAITALVACSAAASAATTTTDWGVHGAAQFGNDAVVGGGTLIDDIYKFSLSAPAGVMSVSVTNDGSGFDLENGVLSLYSGAPSTGTLIGSLSFDSSAVSYNWGALPIGNYYYEVTAKVVDTAIGGSYLLSSTLAPVPEPESYAMLLGGLGVVGLVVTRRQRAGR
jgi:hypothetical protein